MKKEATSSASAEKFLVIPVLVMIMAQMGTTGENSAMSLSANALATMFNATTADYQLANMIYSLVAGALMIAGGMTGVILGWLNNFRIGVILCGLGELVCALSPSMFILTWVGRALVGLGASFMIPSVLGLVPCIYKSGANRAIAFGAIGAASGIATILPVLFGFLMESFGFRVTFGILAGYFGLVFLASFALPKIEEVENKPKFDFIGTGLAALGLFMFLIGISRFSAWGIITPLPAAPFSVLGLSPALVLTIAGIVVLGIMVVIEKRVEEKNGCCLLPQSFYKTPQVVAGLVACFQIFFASALVGLIVVPYVQRVVGWNAIQAAAIAVSMGIPMFLFALLIPKFAAKVHPRTILALGYIFMGVGSFAIMFAISAAGVNNLLWVGAVLIGVGAGLLSAHCANVIALAVNDRDASQSGGVQATSRNVGYAVAIAALGTILLFGINSGIASAVSTSSTISDATKTAITATNIDMMSDRDFKVIASEITSDPAEIDELTSINSAARTSSVRLSLGVGAAWLLLSLVSCPWIKIASRDEQ